MTESEHTMHMGVDGMNDFELRKLLGGELYESGYPIYRNGDISRLPDPIDGVSLYRVEGSTVLVRNYDNERPALYDCDCSCGKCRHIAAVIISENYDEHEEPVDDPEDIADIRKLIESLYDDVTSDSGYDEEENYYDDWEVERYDLELNNAEVEYEYTLDICKKIKSCIREPDNMARLFTELFVSLDDFEYDNDGFERALNEFSELITTSYTCASGEVLAQALAQGTYQSEPFLRALSCDVLENAYAYLKKLEVRGHFGRDLLFEHGDFDEYLNANNSVHELMKVLDKLIADGKMDEGRRIFTDHYSPECSEGSYGKSLLIPYLVRLGLDEVSSQYCYELYLEEPCEKYFIHIRCGEGSHSEEELLGYARSKYLSADVPDYDILAFLLEHDRKFVLDEISRTGFVSQFTSYRYRDLEPAKKLYRHLAAKKLYGAAAIIGRGVIATRIDDKDNKKYGDAVEILREMGKDKGFESVTPPHSEYLADLRNNHNRMRKFWGLYDGTW